MKRHLLLAALMVLLWPGAGAAQQTPPDTANRTPAQRVLDRLRSLRPVAAPDTIEVADTLRAPPDRIEVRSQELPSAGGVERDSIMQALAGLAGYVATEYRGGEARFHADSGRLQLRRNAEVVREGQRMQADSSVVYSESTGIACGYGRPTVTGSTLENPLTSDTLCYNIEAGLGVAKNARTSISQGANWEMQADVYTVADSMYAHDALFTDCNEPWPHKHYLFSADEVKVIQNNVLVARNVTMRFADVPVFWLPFMVQSLSRGRRSGILMPRFGINDIARTNSNYSRRVEDVGVFWAINDYMGAEVAMDWMSENYTALRGSLDYKVLRQFLDGTLTFRRFWKTEGGKEFTLSSSNSWAPNENTRIGLNANYSTSSQFIRRRTLDPREINRSIDSNLNMNRQFGWGSLTAGATRSQYLSDGTVRMTLPSLGLNLSSITLFGAEPGEERWFSNATWSGTADARLESTALGAENTDVNAQSRRNSTANVTSRFTLGKLGLNQDLRLGEDQYDAREVTTRLGERDTLIALPERNEQRGSWSTSLSYQQNLIGTTTSLTPSLRLNGEFVRNQDTEEQLLSAPTRMDFAVSLNTAVFGFWPGAGPLQRVRHRVSPSFSYTYSPAATADSLQRAVFRGAGTIEERNQLSISLSQTFEGKRKSRPQSAEDAAGPVGPGVGDTAAVPGDSAAIAARAALAAAATRDSAAAVEDTATGPRRLPPGESPIILLSINTDAVVYDFVKARDGQGVQTMQIGNSISSDLLRGLTLRFTHDLFQEAQPAPGADTDVPVSREFKPHLSSVNAGFSLSSDSWLFRVLGLGPGRTMPEQRGEAGATTPQPATSGPALDRTKPEMGLMGSSRRDPVGVQSGAVGSWNASVDYTLDRPRKTAQPSLGDRGENQMLTARASFQPTTNWTMNWRTGYNVTQGEFTDHMLTLTRRLHDWDANFDFVKAQNGNFSFQFRVHLRANPDIKLDYEQHDMGGLTGQPTASRFR